MKTTLTFDFDNPEADDRQEFDDCIKGADYRGTLVELDQALRNITKHGDFTAIGFPPITIEITADALAEKVRDFIREQMAEFGGKLL